LRRQAFPSLPPAPEATLQLPSLLDPKLPYSSQCFPFKKFRSRGGNTGEHVCFQEKSLPFVYPTEALGEKLKALLRAPQRCPAACPRSGRCWRPAGEAPRPVPAGGRERRRSGAPRRPGTPARRAKRRTSARCGSARFRNSTKSLWPRSSTAANGCIPAGSSTRSPAQPPPQTSRPRRRATRLPAGGPSASRRPPPPWGAATGSAAGASRAVRTGAQPAGWGGSEEELLGGVRREGREEAGEGSEAATGQERVAAAGSPRARAAVREVKASPAGKERRRPGARSGPGPWRGAAERGRGCPRTAGVGSSLTPWASRYVCC